MSFDYMSELNQEQRHAVEHGVKSGSAKNTGPLLVIAGAGSGKTKTLAHRVAHLIVNGIDPHRILLLTFSRRAAAEMTGRVRRITAQYSKPVRLICRGPVPFTQLVPGCLGNMRIRLASKRRLRFLTGQMPLT
jgi:superfamily I DNA/RNA helicase